MCIYMCVSEREPVSVRAWECACVCGVCVRVRRVCAYAMCVCVCDVWVRMRCVGAYAMCGWRVVVHLHARVYMDGACAYGCACLCICVRVCIRACDSLLRSVCGNVHVCKYAYTSPRV